MQYSQLIARIQADIYDNGAQLITGNVLQGDLLAMVSALASSGAGYGGIITPNSSAPASLDQATFYLAIQPGTYSSFGVTVTEPSIVSYGGESTLTFTVSPLGLAPAPTVVKLYTGDDPYVLVPLTGSDGMAFMVDIEGGYSGGATEVYAQHWLVNYSADNGVTIYVTGDKNVTGMINWAKVYEDNGDLFLVLYANTGSLDYITMAFRDMTGNAVSGITVEPNITGYVYSSDAVIRILAGNGEDIDYNAEGLLQFADRPTADNQMGYIILRKNKTFAEQVTAENTIYEIRYAFDLGGASVTIPEGCILSFNGGSISNGTLIGQDTCLEGLSKNSLLCSFGGSFESGIYCSNIFGIIPSVSEVLMTNQHEAFLRLSTFISSAKDVTIEFLPGYYGFGKETYGQKQNTYLGWNAWNQWYAIFVRDSSVNRSLSLIGDNSHFINMIRSHYGSWLSASQASTYSASQASALSTQEKLATSSCGGGFLYYSTLNDCNLSVIGIDIDMRVSNALFGGSQAYSENQCAIWVSTGGDVYLDGVRSAGSLQNGFIVITRDGIDAENVTIKNSIFENSMRGGCEIDCGDHVLVERCQFKNNGNIYDVNSYYQFEGAYLGLGMENNHKITGDVTIVDCEFYNNNSRDISITGHGCLELSVFNVKAEKTHGLLSYENTTSTNILESVNLPGFSSCIVVGDTIMDGLKMVNCALSQPYLANQSYYLGTIANPQSGDYAFKHSTGNVHVRNVVIFLPVKKTAAASNRCVGKAMRPLNFKYNGSDWVEVTEIESGMPVCGNYFIENIQVFWNDMADIMFAPGHIGQQYKMKNLTLYCNDTMKESFIKYDASSPDIGEFDGVTIVDNYLGETAAPVISLNPAKIRNYKYIKLSGSVSAIKFANTAGITSMLYWFIAHDETQITGIGEFYYVESTRKVYTCIQGQNTPVFVSYCPHASSQYGATRPKTLTTTDRGYLFWDLNLARPIFWNGSAWADANGFLANKNKGASTERPSLYASQSGFMFYDSTLKKMILWNGSAWVNMDGSVL